MIRAFVLALSVVLMSTPALAEEVSAERVEKVKELLETSGFDDVMQTVVKQMAEQINADVKMKKPAESAHFYEVVDEEIRGLVSAVIEDVYVVTSGLYYESFTDEEIDTMIAFNKTPLGQKVAKLQPVISEKTMVAMQQGVISRLPGFVARLNERLREEGFEGDI